MRTRIVIVILIGLSVLAPATTTLAEAVPPEAPTSEVESSAPLPVAHWLDRLQTAASISFIVGGLLGALAGGGSALMILARIDRQTKDQAERLFESLSPSWQATIVRAVRAAEEAVQTAAVAVRVLNEVTDGRPNTDEPAS